MDNSLYLDEKNLIENNKVYFELSKPIDTNDLDVLEMFLESRKQSGGGDIIDKKFLANDKLGSDGLKRLNDLPKMQELNDCLTMAKSCSLTTTKINEDLNNNNQAELAKDGDIDDAEALLDKLTSDFSRCTSFIDYESSDKIPKRSLVVIYEEKEAKERILQRKFLKFKDYFIRSSQSGFMNDSQKPNSKLLILYNIDENEDKYIIELYADYLLRDNQLVDLRRSCIFDKTYFLEFEADFDFDSVYERYLKKPQLRNKKIFPFKAYQTNSLLIRSKDRTKGDKYDSKVVIECCNELNKLSESESLNSSNGASFTVLFAYEGLNHVLVQFEDQACVDKFLEINGEKLSATGLCYEYCWNYDFYKQFLSEDTAVEVKKINNSTKSHKNKSIQTDITKKELESMINELARSKKQEVKEVKASKKLINSLNIQSGRRDSEPPISKQNSAVGKSQPKASSPPINTNTKLILNENGDPMKIYLSHDQPFSIGLLNAKQLFVNFSLFLKKQGITASVETKKDEKSKLDYSIVSVKLRDRNQRAKAISLIHEFCMTEFDYQKIKLKDYLSGNLKFNAQMGKSLTQFLNDLNKRYPATYFVSDASFTVISTYGVKKPLNRVIDETIQYFKNDFSKILSIIEQNTTKNSTNSRTSESKDTNRLSVNSAMSRTSSNDSSNNSSDLKNTLNSKLGSISIIISSYDSEINRFKLFDKQTKLLLVPIICQLAPSEYPVLTKCLLYCSKIHLDFHIDLFNFNQNLEMVFYDSKTNDDDKNAKPSKVLTIVPKIELSEVELNKINAYKPQLLNFLNEYEKYKLKHQLIKLKDSLNREEFYDDIMKRIKNKNDLDKLRKLIDIELGSSKVIHLEINTTGDTGLSNLVNGKTDDRYFEFYGYTQAVKHVNDYVQSSLGKINSTLMSKMQNKLEFQLSLKKHPNLIIFFKFNDIYFQDFTEKLKNFDAFAVKLNNSVFNASVPNSSSVTTAAALALKDSKPSLQIGCTNAKLRSKKLDSWEDIEKWRANLDNFISFYLSIFSIELIDMPFKRDDLRANNLLYDQNLIDVIWLTNQKLQVTGIKEEINLLKQKIYQM